MNRLFARFLNFAAKRRSAEHTEEVMDPHVAAPVQRNLRAKPSPPVLENLLFDVRYSLRVLYKSPLFTAVAALTLMFGIGANIVVFGVLNAVVLRPLAVSDPQSLYQLRHKQWMSGRLLTTSYSAFEDFRRRNTTFSGMAGVYGYSFATLRWGNAVVDIHGDEVSGNYFDVLGVQPALGRYFHATDEHGPGSAPYLVLGDDLWRRVFGGDRGIVGKTVELDDHPFTVLGVASARFHGAERFVWPDYWIPMMNEQQVREQDYLHSRTAIAVTVLGRLKPGVTPQQATDNLNAIAVQLAKEYPRTDEALPLRLIHPGLWGDEGDVIRGFLYSVNLLALLVLAAACANLASLFAARAADRSRELAVRVALGSSRWRLVRQLLTEATLISLIGGAAGLMGADLLLGLLNRWPQAAEVHLAAGVDAHVYLTGLLLTLGSALLFGMIPARQAWRSSPLQMMKSQPADGLCSRQLTLRDLLLGAQIAICTLLVTSSLVAVRGLQHALETPLGIQPRGVMLVDMNLGQAAGNDDAAIAQQKRIIEAARSIPGVTAAGMVNRTPMTGGLHGIPVYRPATVEFTMKNYAMAPYVFSMSPGYLDTAGTRLRGGRDFSWQDTAATPHVALVNETFAHKMWGATRAIGQHFILWGNLTEVIGVTEDGKYHDMTEPPQAVAYVPLSQSQQTANVFMVRSQRAPNEMAAALQSMLSGIAPNVPIRLQSWNDTLSSELFPARAATAFLGVMGLLAAMLAVTGIFGMGAYNVSRRMKEFGIRVALGARNKDVMQAAVGRPIALLALGSFLGLVAGVFASRLLGRIVYQADPRDPLVIGGAVLMMTLLGVLASAIPARRALAVDPSKLMREE